MQTNYNYGAIVGLIIIVLIGAIALGVFITGVLDPEKQATANRTYVENAYLQGKYDQDLAARQAEIEAAIAMAPANAQLDLERQAQALAQQKRDYEINATIKTVGFPVVLVSVLIVAISYAATRRAAVQQPPQPTARPTPASAVRHDAPPPVPHPVTSNGRGDGRLREYRQMIELIHAEVKTLNQRVTDLENQNANLVQYLNDVQTTLQQTTAENRTLNAELMQLNARTRRSVNGEGVFGGANGTGDHGKDLLDPDTVVWRRAA